MRSRAPWVLASLILLAVAACVGDSPAGGAGASSREGGSSGQSSSSGESGSSSSSSSSGSGSGATDASIDGDAAAAPCGFAGEVCCEGSGPAPCSPGTACGGDGFCAANDIWVVGHGGFLNPFGLGVHFDGTAWTLAASTAGNPSGKTNVKFESVWGSEPGRYYAVGSLDVGSSGDVGSVYGLSGDSWRRCGALEFGCGYPTETSSTSLWSIFGFGVSDYWLAGDETLAHCTGSSSCPSKETGIAAWGQGNLTGTSSSDLWYVDVNNAYHFDGNAWTSTAVTQARSIWAFAPNDVWVGDQRLQHFDGATWSNEYSIEGLPTVGLITGIHGSASDDVWAVGYNNAAGENYPFSAHYDGTRWSHVDMPFAGQQITGLWVPSRKQAFAVSFDGGIFEWAGAAWSKKSIENRADGATVYGQWAGVFGSARHR